jgi:hypothetical protein
VISHYGFRPATDDVVTTLQREAEMRAVKHAVHLALLDKERARLITEREAAAALELAKAKKRRGRIAEIVAWVTTSVAVIWMLMRSGAK